MFKSLAFFLVFLNAPALRAQLTVNIIDVGQGDSIYIELPSGGNVLIDGGPSGEPVYDFLKAKGVEKIDHLVLTHPHADHYRGLKKVFAAVDVKNFYDTHAENIDAAGDNNLRLLAAAEPDCKTHFPDAGDELIWDPKVTVKVLNSCAETVLSRDNDVINNCSIALRFYYNGTGLLFMGDAEASIENALASIFKSGLNSQVLKVGHHGSRFSTTAKFLSRVRPKYAYISFGVDNIYGHPHMEAQQRLSAAGAKIIYTIGGTQTFTIPAPKEGQSFPPELVFNGIPANAEQRFEDMTLTWTPESAGSDSPALTQLEHAAWEAGIK